MTRHAVNDARDRIADDLARVEKTGEPVSFEKDGKPVAVLVSAEAFAQFERLREDAEDRLDAAEADRILDSSRPEDFEAWDKVKTELGL